MRLNSDFRNEVMSTNKGRLLISNKMGYAVTFYINGARWRIPRGKHSISVPLGTVTVHTSSEVPRELRGWKLSESGGHYELGVSIKPRVSVPRGF